MVFFEFSYSSKCSEDFGTEVKPFSFSLVQVSFLYWTNFTQFKKDFESNHFFIFIFLFLQHIIEALLDIQLYIYIQYV